MAAQIVEVDFNTAVKDPSHDPVKLRRYEQAAEDLRRIRAFVTQGDLPGGTDPAGLDPKASKNDKISYGVAAMASSLTQTAFSYDLNGAKQTVKGSAQRLIDLLVRRTAYDSHARAFTHGFAAYLLEVRAHGLETPAQLQVHLAAFHDTPDEVRRVQQEQKTADIKNTVRITTEILAQNAKKAAPATTGTGRRKKGGGGQQPPNTPKTERNRRAKRRGDDNKRDDMEEEEEEAPLPLASGSGGCSKKE